MEQSDKNHLQNIDKVEIHNHNHVDLAEILSLLNVIKFQNHKILDKLEKQGDVEALEKQMDSWLFTLGKSVDKIKVVSDQVDSSK